MCDVHVRATLLDLVFEPKYYQSASKREHPGVTINISRRVKGVGIWFADRGVYPAEHIRKLRSAHVLRIQRCILGNNGGVVRRILARRWVTDHDLTVGEANTTEIPYLPASEIRAPCVSSDAGAFLTITVRLSE